MFLEILLAITIGVLTGVITGLTPGIHINLISALAISFAPAILKVTSPISLVIFIVSMSVVHTFLDSIPSIFLGAPDSATALGVLPGHRYLLKGYGLMAVKLTLIGSLGAVILSIVLFPLFVIIVKNGYPLIKDYIGYMLIFVVVFMILRDRKKFWALFVFLLSGCLGLVVLNMPLLKNPLFPLFSGMYGISTLIISLNTCSVIPKQKEEQHIKLKPLITLKALFSGQFSGFLTAVLPGLGAATAAVISMQITRKLGDNGFMVLMGSIGTVNFILSLATLYVLDKARNGSIIAVQQITETSLGLIMILLMTIIISASLAVYLTLKIGKLFARHITKINYRKLVYSIIIFITILVFMMTGFIGLAVLVTSTAIGIIPAIIKVTRTQAMGCLLLPVILYFI